MQMTLNQTLHHIFDSKDEMFHHLGEAGLQESVSRPIEYSTHDNEQETRFFRQNVS